MDQATETATKPKPKRGKTRRIVKTQPSAKKVTPRAPKPKATEAGEKPKAARAPLVHAHVEAGVINTWEGDSSFLNSNVPAAVRKRDTANITTRRAKALYALRARYGDKTFVARGIDNAVLSKLEAAGLIRLSGGREEVKDGHVYRKDGEKPLTVAITAKGQNYGKAAN